MTNNQYRSLKAKYNDISILKHDIKNHLQTLYILADQKNIDKVKTYLEDHLNILEQYQLYFHSSHQLLEIIINEKHDEALKNNITFEIEYTDDNYSFIADIDMITIMANALDNAIEANIDIKENRYIKIYFFKKNNYLFIQIENPYNNTIKTHNEKILTTKQNHSGIGLSSIKKAVEKYNGILSYKYENNLFQLMMFIPFKQ
jgi:sensor histidine kinase regulating citrate/malate metabolism